MTRNVQQTQPLYLSKYAFNCNTILKDLELLWAFRDCSALQCGPLIEESTNLPVQKKTINKR